MTELEEYRANLIQQLEGSANAFREACLAVREPHAPVEANGWSVHQAAVHTRDVNSLVYAARARRTAAEENPEFPNFDGDAYMAEHYAATEPLPEVLDSFVASVQALTDWLRGLPAEAWSRVSRHPTLGRELTLQSWVEKDLAHIEEHLAAVKKGSRADP